ncbi:unnamed protein product [Merluccius merluccius]
MATVKMLCLTGRCFPVNQRSVFVAPAACGGCPRGYHFKHRFPTVQTRSFTDRESVWSPGAPWPPGSATFDLGGRTSAFGAPGPAGPRTATQRTVPTGGRIHPSPIWRVEPPTCDVIRGEILKRLYDSSW